jgi:L-cystine transport system permease protein
MLIYIGLPVIIDGLSEHYGWGFRSASIPMIGFAYVSLSITAGAYISEVVRSGLLAVNRGQMEAAHSIGMTTWQAMRRIVIPQAFALNLSNISNMVIGMLHGSSLAFIVSVVDISAKAKIVASSNWKFFEANLAAALIYWGLVILIERGTLLLEKRIHAFNHGGVA